MGGYQIFSVAIFSSQEQDSQASHAAGSEVWDGVQRGVCSEGKWE